MQIKSRPCTSSKYAVPGPTLHSWPSRVPANEIQYNGKCQDYIYVKWAYNSPVECPSRDCKHDMKESECNMCNPIFQANVRGRNIQVVAHLQNHNYLISHRKLESVVQKVKKWPLKSRPTIDNYHNENHDEIEFYQGNSKRSTYG